MNTPPKTLYKYIAPDRISVLCDALIRFTQPSALNDPFEMDLYFKELFDYQEVASHIRALDIESMIEQSLTKEISKMSHLNIDPAQQEAFRIVASELMRNKLEAIGVEGFEKLMLDKSKLEKDRVQKGIIESLHSQIGILSLSEDPLSPPMWGNYAQSSRGIAIGFSSHHPFFNQKQGPVDELRHLRKVIYEDREPALTMKRINSDVFVLKKKSWAYEQEWRMLLPLDSSQNRLITEDGDVVHLFSYPRDAVVEVILGLNTTQNTINKCLDSLGQFSSNIEVKKVEKSGHKLVLVPYFS